MKYAVFVLIAVATLALTSCSTMTDSGGPPTLEVSQVPYWAPPTLEVSQVPYWAPPKLEVSQVPFHWEVIIRLRDELAGGHSVRCTIYRAFWDGTDSTEVRVAEVRLAQTEDRHEFIGIYSNGKVLPHGTEVVVIYEPSSDRQPVRAKTTMIYH